MDKKVYICMTGDTMHPGYLNVVKKAQELGKVTVGLLTDSAISSYKKIPYLNFEQRKLIMENIKGIDEVIAQHTLDYTENLLKLKPDYVVNGDDWRTGIQRHTREKVIETLREWGGELIEIEYTKGISNDKLNYSLKHIGITPNVRMQRLRRLLNAKPLLRFIEAHNGLTAMIADKLNISDEKTYKEFDGVWMSSLTESTARGKPDIELFDMTSRVNTLNDILEATTKPVIFDGDTGGQTEHFVFSVKALERLGVSAIIIEDKTGLKKNSLFGTDVKQTQDSIENFSHKIETGKKSQVTEDFMIIARIESLILKKGLDDALKRASAYIDAGADGIMIHSKESTYDEIYNFCKSYKKFNNRVPLVVVPSTYSHVKESELVEAGVNIVIYANQLIRAAYPAMINAAKTILKNDRAKECDEFCMPIKDIINLISGAL